jgi:hypothetical protein
MGTTQEGNKIHLEGKGARVMSEVNSVVAIYETHSQAEEAVKVWV